ncbi:hypothetical protein DFP97_112133 [Paenibacillus prosopidis]|uniref:Uncharacterized protein n=1 Tax=Paenibacillus prosopidis TaxID=630520 RepID=A0A368VRD2_9BACL|nr:hypothetical protein DFP97_112133 [Paenibacillus prosopidis]
MDDNLRKLALNIINKTEIKETKNGLIDFIALTLQSPVSTRVVLHLQPDHPGG